MQLFTADLANRSLPLVRRIVEDIVREHRRRTEQLRYAIDQILADAIKQQNSTTLMHEINRLKIPAGIIQNVQEALSSKEAIDISMEGGNLKGLRNFVGYVSNLEKPNQLLPPPHFGEHTAEILNLIAT